MIQSYNQTGFGFWILDGAVPIGTLSTNWYSRRSIIDGSEVVGGHVRVESHVQYGVAHHISGGLHRGSMNACDINIGASSFCYFMS